MPWGVHQGWQQLWRRQPEPVRWVGFVCRECESQRWSCLSLFTSEDDGEFQVPNTERHTLLGLCYRSPQLSLESLARLCIF